MMKQPAVRCLLSILCVGFALFLRAQPDVVFTDLATAAKNPELVYHLDLKKQRLAEVPIELKAFTNLRILDLSKNKIQSLPEWLAELPLVELHLTKNNFAKFPMVLCSMPTLVVLKLDRNPVAALPPEISALRALVTLDLWDTQIEELPATMAQLTNLKYLDLRSTKIYKSELPDLQKLLPNTEILVTNGCDCKK
jgi:Leucine-rich repeat (LRR) protein